ncbi:MAG: ribonuclease P protein component [Clostridia bacterium]|nr:ribonuclease P protein component [Clostridia bacterium]
MSKNKAAILNQNKDFRSLYYRGRSQVSPFLVMYVRKNKFGFHRVGITSGKKLGTAVERNRCRRLIREAYRLLAPEIKGSWDIVFVARTRTVKSSMHQVKAAM